MRMSLTPAHTFCRIAGTVTLVVAASACGSDPDDSQPAPADTSAPTSDTPAELPQIEPPQIIVTTNILGDVVSAAVGDQADVVSLMPVGTDPHDFAPSARQAESMENADLLIINGAGFEEGMLDIIANVSDSGTEVFSFTDQIDLLEFNGEKGHDDDHGDEEGDDHDDDHGDEEGDDHGHHSGDDPHIWTDPMRMATAVQALEPVIAGLPGVNTADLSAAFDAYLADLSALDTSMNATLDAVPEEQRVLVTNHDAFGYFADRFDFEVVGAIIPSLTTNAEPSAADIEELSELIQAEGIRAIFSETTQSARLAETLADDVGGDVQVVELFSGSLGEDGSGAETYLGMMQENADRITGALTS